MFTSSIGYSLIKKDIGNFLLQQGFLPHKTTTFYRITAEDILQFINFQKGVQSLYEQMTINVAIQGLFAPTCSLGRLQPGGRIGQFVGSPKDLWWHCGTEKATQESITDIISILSTILLPRLDQLSTVNRLIDSFDEEKLRFLWWIPSTFIDKGFFFLRGGRYTEGLAMFRANRPSQVGKFKTIQKLVEQSQFASIDGLLQDNVQFQKKRWDI